MMGVCRRLPGGVHASIIETGALCRAGPHGSTLPDRSATRATGVARGKAAQAWLRQRWQLRPHKQRSSFGRRAPKVQRGPRRGPLHSLKGMVPEAAAHILVSVGGWCGGGSGTQRRTSTAVSGRRRWQLACDFTMLAAEMASDFDSLWSSWQLASDFSSLCSLLCLCCCCVQCYVCA